MDEPSACLVPSVFNNDREQLLRITLDKGLFIAHHLLMCGNTWSKANMEKLKDLWREHGHDRAVTKKDPWGNSLFHWAALANSAWVFPSFEGACVPMHTKNAMGLYPINVAIYMKNWDVLEEFIANGLANSNACDNGVETTLHVPAKSDPTKREPVQVHLNPLAYAYMHGIHSDVLQKYQDKYRCIQTFVPNFGDVLFLVVHFDHVDLLRRLVQKLGSVYDYSQKYGWARLMLNSHNNLGLLEYAQAVGAAQCVALLESIEPK